MGRVSFYMYIASGYDMMKYRVGYVHKMLIHVEKRVEWWKSQDY